MEDYTVIIPDYLLNIDNESLQNEEIEDPTQEDPAQEDPVYDYSSILSGINVQLTELNTNLLIVQQQNDDLMHGTEALLKNSSFLVYFCFAFFVFGALCLVIKFFNQFF
ncbi:MAG: hypothetical protein QXI77_01605 [Nanopusillaceae archaeon]